jgi:cell division protein FtsZ
MDTNLQNDPGAGSTNKPVTIKICGVGKAGIAITNHLVHSGIPAADVVAIDMDPESLLTAAAGRKIHLETKMLRGLGSGGDPERGRKIAEEHSACLKTACAEAGVVFIVTGLGGGAGTGISPVLARVAREGGALALAFTTMPFEYEGNRRRRIAREGYEELKEAADGVIGLADQKVASLMDENTSLLETFKITDEFLADGVSGIWRLLRYKGLIEIHLNDLCELLRDQHSDCAFASAEALGPTRSRDVLDKLLAHPLLDGGKLLGESEAVIVSFMGGPDLTIVEVNRVMAEITANCRQAQVIMGAALDESFRDRLEVTIVAARPAPESASRDLSPRQEAEAFDRQLLPASTSRPGSRFVPPAPVLPPEQVRQMLARNDRATTRSRKGSTKMRQTQLPLEIVSKGRFDKSEPTIHKGEDLDVPTYIRRGVALN